MKSKIWLKILSVMIAVLAWIYVNLQTSNQIERIIVLPVNYINEPNGFLVHKPDIKTSVKLTGIRKDFMFAKYSKRYFQAQVDLSGVKEGSYNLPIDIVNIYPGLKLVSASPDSCKINAEEVIKKEFSLSSYVSGEPEDGFIADVPVITPKSVVLRGNAKDINMVQSCYINISLEKIKNSISLNLPIDIKFKEGYEDKSESISKEPANAQVIISVKHGFPTKFVPVAQPTFVGKREDGREVVSWEVIPNQIEISGPLRRINTITEARLRPVVLNDINLGENTVSAVLETLPHAINVVGSPTVLLRLNLSDNKRNIEQQNEYKQNIEPIEIHKESENGN